jgi:hypothetical protein
MRSCRGGVEFRVQGAVKGSPPRQLRIDDTQIGTIRPSDLVDLSQSHHESGNGMCNRYTFERGGRYLLFLDRAEDGSWGQLGYAYSRINEDYAGENNPWMRAVRRYLRLQDTLGPMEQLAALRQMLETGRDLNGRSRLGRTERADIAAHLGSVSPWKPTPMLVDFYERLERGEPLPAPLVSTDRGDDRLTVLRRLAAGDHPSAIPLFERLAAAPQTRGEVRGAVLLYLARHGRYGDAYRWIEMDLLRELQSLPQAEAMALLRTVASVQMGDAWEEGRERWRSHPHAVATWPALSRAIHAYQIRTFGAGNALPFFGRGQQER